MSSQRCKALPPFLAWIALLTSPATGGAQVLVSSIEPDPEPQGKFACSVTPFSPKLGFDLLFHTGYRIHIPLKELARANRELTIVLRVRSERSKDPPVQFVQKFRPPAIDPSASGKATLEGAFRLGEGRYYADLLVRDANLRVCAHSWDVSATPAGKDLVLAGELEKDVIRAEDDDETVSPGYAGDPKPARGGLHVKVIVNFVPQYLHAAKPGQRDVRDMMAILRMISRDQRIGNISVVACSVRTGQPIHRQHETPRVDMQALQEALEARNFNKVDAKQLALRDRETEFLGRLLSEELLEDHLDGVIFVGPKDPLNANVSRAVIEDLKSVNAPVFYLNYSLDPSYYPWPDAIGWVVKQMHGVEYTINRPRDLFHAWADIISRITRAKSPVISRKTVGRPDQDARRSDGLD